MVKKVDYEARRRAVLGATVERYIKEALPISSEDLADAFDLSSATMRNIFVELEHDGYLMHPYTSAGRIPTDSGYRYYVDFLISQMELLVGEKERIVREYNTEIKKLERTLEKTSEILSAITHYTGIVSFLDWQDKIFYKGISCVLEQPEFKDSERIRLLIRMIEEKGRLLEILNRESNEKVVIYIGEELSPLGINNCSLVVSGYRRKNKPSGRLAVLGPKRMDYSHIIPVVDYISEVLTEALDEILDE